jgi:SAM-dependent methyltransferase
MAESAAFILLAGILVILVFHFFHITWIDPRIIIIAMFVFVVPGFYAACTSGPFVPSARKRHRMMLKLAGLSKADIAYDLGCGDGRLVFSAAKHAKKAIGYDLSVPLVLYGKFFSLFYPKSSIRFGDIWKQDYGDANVIFCYLLPKSMKRFHRDIWPKLKKGTRVISNAFPIHSLKPSETEEKVYLYIK